jgi:NADH-quinone oxidoreductase subunit N
MWTPDVYEGAPTPIGAFFASAPKVAAMALLARIMMGPFNEFVAQWQQIVIVISIASMILGSFAAIYQTNIKRLMAYSSIGHIGFALVGLAAGTVEGLRGLIIYMSIYVIMNLGTWGCILCMRQKGVMVEGIEDLKGLSKSHPLMALALAIFMFSMAGIPPLAGFFGKFYVFLAAIESGLYTLAIVGVLSSVIGAFYYLRIVKLMYFDEPVETFDTPIGREMAVVLTGTSLLVLLFFVVPDPLIRGAAAAAAALFAG